MGFEKDIYVFNTNLRNPSRGMIVYALPHALQELNIPPRAVFRSAQREFRARSRADMRGRGKDEAR